MPKDVDLINSANQKYDNTISGLTADQVQAAIDEIALGGGGSGDVIGPAGATNNGLAIFDGTTGKLLKSSTVLENWVVALFVSDQFGGLSVKAAPVGADVLLIEDSQALWAKKKVPFSSFAADLTNAVFPTYAVFNAKVIGNGTIDFAAGQKQEVDAATFGVITLTSPVGKPANWVLRILNSESVLSIAPAAGGNIRWANNIPPIWAGTSTFYFYYDGTDWEGSVNPNIGAA